MSVSPNVSRKSVKILKNWIHGHHEDPNTMKFKTSDRNFNTTDENILELKTQYHKVCNSKVIIDWDLLKELQNKSTKEDLGLPFSYLTFLNVIKTLTLHKAVNLNDISPNAIKDLNEENRHTLFDICVKNFDGEVSIEGW